MAGEGILLKEARKEKGLSLEDVEKQIKIRPFYLKTLEEEEYSALPGTTYARGFLRTYSKFLGLDSNQIIEMFNSSFPKDEEEKVEKVLSPIPSSSVWFKPAVLFTMAFIAIGFVVGITYITKIKEKPDIGGYIPAPLPASPQTQEGSSPSNESDQVNPQGSETEKQMAWLQR